MHSIELVSSFVRASVSPTSAMLVDAEFTVDGRARRPFARAPWVGSDPANQPGHLRVLGAEFVAVPFGSAPIPDDLDASWPSATTPSLPHGLAADADWMITEATPERVTLTLAYPDSDDLVGLTRTIALRTDEAAIDFTLTLHARRDTRVAVGLHPILRLPERARDLHLDVSFARGYTYPGTVWPGAGPTTPARTFERLDAIPAQDATIPDLTTTDFSRLPLSDAADPTGLTEDVVLLAGVSSSLEARFLDDGTRLTLDWDRSVIPSLMLWLSDRALQEEPWLGRYRGLGVEPIAAAFDFDNTVSVGDNPLTRDGFATSVALDADTPLTLHYSVEVGSLDL